MPDLKPILGRRSLLGGAAAASAAAAAVALLPAQPEPLAANVARGQPAPEPASGGYQLTEHVKQYYASARI